MWDEQTQAFLQRYRFSAIPFEEHRRILQDHDDNALEAQNRLTSIHIRPPTPHDFLVPSPEHAQRGEGAIVDGAVGVVVLAGGMATRFGGAVKALVPVAQGRNFLDLKLDQIQGLAFRLGGTIPVYVMTSFATDGAITRHLRRHPRKHVRTFSQFISLRMERNGDVYRDERGLPSLYAPGHGDLGPALLASGALAHFAQSGGRHLFVCNVDNLGATLDPQIVGAHMGHRAPVSVEVTAKLAHDRGGAPAWVDHRLQVVESFRFPEHFDESAISVFNTNTFMFDVSALRAPHGLDWFAVKKKVFGRVVYQFERLVGQVTAFERSRYLRVPRTRFTPVKTRADLQRLTADLQGPAA